MAKSIQKGAGDVHGSSGHTSAQGTRSAEEWGSHLHGAPRTSNPHCLPPLVAAAVRRDTAKLSVFNYGLGDSFPDLSPGNRTFSYMLYLPMLKFKGFSFLAIS